MSLGTGALKVGREPERLRHSKEVSMTTLRAGTIPACSCQLAPSHWKNSLENTAMTPYLPMHAVPYLPNEGKGRAGSQIPQRFA